MSKTDNTMLPWITSKQFVIDLFPKWAKTEGDKDWSLGAVTADVVDIERRMAGIVAELNADQWEIKMVVPMSKSLTYHEHQKVVRAGGRKEPDQILGAFGLGWAAGATSSLLIVAQRTEWIDAAEYKTRMKNRNEAEARAAKARDRAEALEHNAAVNGKITEAQRTLASLRDMLIEGRRSGLFRGERFTVAGTDYNTRSEAEAAKAARIAELERDLIDLPKQLRVIVDEA